MFGDFFGGLPLHPLVVHAVVIFLIAAGLGVIALAVRPSWRHKYGYLLGLVAVAGVASTWVAVESGNILTKVPGLGRTAHAEAGTLLLVMTVPWAVLVLLMVGLDRWWMVDKNKHGTLYRKAHAVQPWWLTVICVLAVLASVAIMVQTGLVGHSGAEASWGDVNVKPYE